jgi:uncharacterized membrane protein HdeD (DUF308 family)
MATLTRSWWLLVLRGVAAILFGILTVLWPGASLASLVLLFGVYALIEGLTSFVLALMRAEGRTGTWVLHALVGIGAGVATFVYPGLTAMALYTIIAGWAIATGIVEISVAFELRDVGAKVGAIVFAGVVSILFGAILVALPAAGVVALVGVIAALAILSGISWVAFGVRLHRLA